MGITKVKNKDALFDAIRLAAEMDDMVIVEKGVVGREIEVGVLGNLKIKSSYIFKCGNIRLRGEISFRRI